DRLPVGGLGAAADGRGRGLEVPRRPRQEHRGVHEVRLQALQGRRRGRARDRRVLRVRGPRDDQEGLAGADGAAEGGRGLRDRGQRPDQEGGEQCGREAVPRLGDQRPVAQDRRAVLRGGERARIPGPRGSAQRRDQGGLPERFRLVREEPRPHPGRVAEAVREVDLEAALARLGYAAFRPGQREAVETLLAQGRLLLVAPTGGGKSLSYQLPATLLPGTTLVISPLVALMADQVQALEARGVAATYLAATLDAAEMRRRMGRLAARAFRLVYVAPERLAFPGFRAMLRDLDVPLVAIDEAHCISEWGHDFRPEYLEIGGVIADLPWARVLACTATATPIVRDEILSRLGLPPDTPQMVRGFARPN